MSKNVIKTSIYDKNMAVLRETHKLYADWIGEQPDHAWMYREGEQLWVKEYGRPIPMYDVKNPRAGVEDVVKLAAGHKEQVTVFIGVGLGHALKAVLDNMEKGHHVIVIEPIGHMMRMMLSVYDLTEYIKSKALLFAPTKAEVDYLFSLMESVKVIEDWNVLVERITRLRPEYWKLSAYCIETLNQIQCNTGTVVSAGGKIADNDIATLPYVIRNRGVNDLKDLFKGKPAVMVGTGPSLAKNIHLLREKQGNVIIVAVAQALRPLLAYDIKPDFICTVDFGEVNMTHLAGLMDEDVPLVTINKAYAPMLRAYKGPKFISASVNPGYENTAHGILQDKGELVQGGSVAHMAYGLCMHLGCNPVMFMGMDLALGETSHFMQADSAGHVTVKDDVIMWEVDDPRSKTLHGRKDISMGRAVYVPGWWGKDVLTNTGLMTFITAFERLIEAFPIATIDCTEGGSRKRGAKRMLLSTALEKHAQEIIDKSALNPLLTLDPKGDETIRKLIPLLANDIKTLDVLIKHCTLGLDTVNKLRETSSPRKLLKLFEENGKHSVVAFEASKRLPTIALTIYGASRAIQGRSMNVEADPRLLSTAKYKKERVIRINRNEHILKAAKTAAETLRVTYEETRNILVEYGQGKTSVLDPAGDPDAPTLRDAMHYLNTKSFAKPLLEARRILKTVACDSEEYDNAGAVQYSAEYIRNELITKADVLQQEAMKNDSASLPEYLDLIDEALEIGRNDSKYEEALTLLVRANELQPNKSEALWGMASAYNALGKMQDAKAAYKTLVETFPENTRYKFEYGQILVKLWADNEPVLRLREGLNWISKVMEATDEFDYFLITYAAILKRAGLEDEAKRALASYLLKYPHDKEAVWELL